MLQEPKSKTAELTPPIIGARPAGHGMHAVWFDSGTCPAVHGLHDVLFAAAV